VEGLSVARRGIAHFQAARLRALRAARGLTQGELATAIEVGRRSVTLWETGGRAPDLAVLVRLVAVLGCDIADLVVVPAQERTLLSLRILSGLSQEAAATALGWSRQTLYAVETGERAPSDDQRATLARVYRCAAADVSAAAVVTADLRHRDLQAKLHSSPDSR